MPIGSQSRSLPRGSLAILLSLVVLIGIAGAVYIKLQYVDARQTVEREMSTIADLKAAQIAIWWRARHSDAEVVFKTPMIQAHVLKFLSGSAPAGPDLLAWMEMWRALHNDRQLILYDARGKPRLSTPPISSISNTADDQNFQAALRGRGILATDLHPSGGGAAGERPRIDLSLWIPMGVKPGTDAPAQGALLIEIDPQQFLYPLLQSWPSPSRTVETLLIRREGDEVVYLTPLRHRANAELSFRLPIYGRRTLPEALGRAGAVEGEDYHHVPVLAAVRRVSGTPWVMVSKQDQEEIYAPYRRGSG
jgi:two-component system, sensor histidine kinase and response regulator